MIILGLWKMDDQFKLESTKLAKVSTLLRKGLSWSLVLARPLK